MPVGFPDYYGGLTLPVTVAEGGTGQTSVTANTILIGQGSSKLIESNIGTSGQVLTIDPVTLVPTFETPTVPAGGITGIVAIANGGTGTATGSITGTGALVFAAGGTNNPITLQPSGTTESLGVTSIAGNNDLVLNIGGTQIWDNRVSGYTGITARGSQILLLNQTIIAFRGGASNAHDLSLYVTTGGVPTIQSQSGDTIQITTPVSLSTPLAVAYGGTGTATPGLVAGANIALSGAWPDQTIALNATPSITQMNVTPASTGTGITLLGNTTGPISPALILYDNTAALQRGTLGLAEAAGNFLSSAAAGDICLRAITGNLLLGTSTTAALTIDQSQVVTLAHPLAVASGGTGTATPALVAGTNILLSGTWPDQTIAVANPPTFSNLKLTGTVTELNGSATVGMGVPAIYFAVVRTTISASITTTNIGTNLPSGTYRISTFVYLDSGTGSSSVDPFITFTYNGVAFTVGPGTVNATTGSAKGESVNAIQIDNLSTLSYQANFTSGGAGDFFDLYIVVERLA